MFWQDFLLSKILTFVDRDEIKQVLYNLSFGFVAFLI
jgi:hypothetical protein